MNVVGGRRIVSDKIDKPHQTKYVLRRLGRYIWPYKWWFVLALTLTIASNLLALVGPRFSGYAIDAITPGKGQVQFEAVFKYSALMLVFYILSAILTYILAVLMIHISQKIVFQMRCDVYHKFMALPVGYFDRYQTGDIISKISYDIDTINTSLSTDLIQIAASLITVVGSFAMMLTISPLLILIFVVTIPLSIGTTRYLTGRTKPLFRQRSRSLGALNGFVEERITGERTLRAYHREAQTVLQFDEKNKEAVEASYKAEYYSSIVGPSINFINNFSLALISVFGALLYLVGKMTLGNISTFILYSRKFSGPINEMANIMSELQSACAAAERVFDLLDEEVEKEDFEGAKVLEEVKGKVTFEGVSFGYTKEKTVLHQLNLLAEPGHLVAIVGPTGAGKSTLVNLLMRFYEIEEGHITIDSQPIHKVTRKSLRQAFAMVLQETWLFEGTFFENIAYGKAGATKEEVIAAAKAAKIHSYIKKLPRGYDTLISENGTTISKGQKQLLTIARAMLMDAKMLILDEATSNVDTRTEVQIQKAMRNLMKDKTCFVIAHRLSTIRHADLILVVKDGEVIEQGTHTELLGQKGFYHQLYEAQFE